MTVQLESEPMAALGAYLLSSEAGDPDKTADIAAEVAVDSLNRPMLFKGDPPDAGPYPIVCYYDPSRRGRGTDVEQFQGANANLTIDVVASNTQVADKLMGLVSAKETYNGSRSLDTTHYVVTILVQRSPWVQVPLPGRLDQATGQPVVLWTSDWEFRYGRKQNVA